MRSLLFFMAFLAPLAAQDRAAITLLGGGPSSVAPGGRLDIRVRLTNTGTTRWSPVGPTYRDGAYFVSIGMINSADASDYTGPVIPLPREVAVGETIDVSGSVNAPDHPGRYTVAISMLLAGAYRFAENGRLPNVAAELNVSARFTLTVTTTSTNSGQAQGLVAYYQEDSQGAHPNSVGSSNGSAIGTVGFTTNGKIGGASTFNANGNGSDPHVKATLSGVDTWTAGTISLWVRPVVSSGTDNQTILQIPEAGSYGHRWLYINPRTRKVSFYVGTGQAVDSNATSITTVNDNTWYHLVAIWDKNTNTAALYVNGNREASITIPRWGTTTNEFHWGAGFNGYGTRGTIDEIGVWSRALRSDEVSALYNSGNGARPGDSTDGPTISSVQPTSVRPGGYVRIEGTFPNPAQLAVTIDSGDGEQPAVAIRAASTEVYVLIPPLPRGSDVDWYQGPVQLCVLENQNRSCAGDPLTILPAAVPKLPPGETLKDIAQQSVDLALATIDEVGSGDTGIRELLQGHAQEIDAIVRAAVAGTPRTIAVTYDDDHVEQVSLDLALISRFEAVIAAGEQFPIPNIAAHRAKNRLASADCATNQETQRVKAKIKFDDLQDRLNKLAITSAASSIVGLGFCVVATAGAGCPPILGGLASIFVLASWPMFGSQLAILRSGQEVLLAVNLDPERISVGTGEQATFQVRGTFGNFSADDIGTKVIERMTTDLAFGFLPNAIGKSPGAVSDVISRVATTLAQMLQSLYGVRVADLIRTPIFEDPIGVPLSSTTTFIASRPAGSIAQVELRCGDSPGRVVGGSVATGATASGTYRIEATNTMLWADQNIAPSASLLIETRSPVAFSRLRSLTVSPSQTTGGTSVEGSVDLTGAAPAGGARITISSDNAAAVPSSTVTIPAGATTVTFAIRTLTVTVPQTATIRASYLGDVTSATLRISPPPTTSSNAGLVFVKNGNIWIMNTDGTNQRALTSTGTVSQVRLSNGVLVYKSGGTLWRRTVTSATATQIPNTSGIAEFDIDPSGQRVVMTAGTLQTMNLDGTNRRTKTANALNQLYPSWGRDGYIYFGQSVGNNASLQRLYRIPENGSTPVALTSTFSQYPAAGGPGNRVAFLVNLTDAERTIRLMNADGTGQTAIPNAPVGLRSPISFDYSLTTVYYELNGEIWSINTSTGVRTRLATGTDRGMGVDYGTLP